MKIFLSALDKYTLDELKKSHSEILWNLLSFYQIHTGSPANTKLFDDVLNASKEVLIDSGAHSFQKGKKVDWVEYTEKYARFIQANDSDKILGYFEMDVDNIIGYDKVLQLRKILTNVTNKVIPVWHKNRGIEDFKRMCEEYRGRIVAISGFQNEDISDTQFKMFVDYAHRCGCKIHGLGLTRFNVLNEVPFDFVDSASWKLQTSYGKVAGYKNRIKRMPTTEYAKVWAYNYRYWVKKQHLYWLKYHKIHND